MCLKIYFMGLLHFINSDKLLFLITRLLYLDNTKKNENHVCYINFLRYNNREHFHLQWLF